MIVCDDPAVFFATPDGTPVRDMPKESCRLWAALAPGRPAYACGGPVPAQGWETGFLVASPRHSQFDALREATAVQPLTGRLWCLAGAGTGCRGQHGRNWQALPGNLHLSVGLPATPAVTGLGAVLNALPAVVALDAVRALLPGGPAPAIKWVNDLWLAGGKVGGVLTAVRQRPEGGEVFLGLGLNVAVAPPIATDRFTPQATCLDAHAPHPLDLAAVLAVVLAAITNRWQELGRSGTSGLLEAYRGACAVTGRRVSIWHDNGDSAAAPLATGRVACIADDLGLMLEGEGRILREGRLALEEP